MLICHSCTNPFPTAGVGGDTIFSMLWAKRTTRCEEMCLSGVGVGMEVVCKNGYTLQYQEILKCSYMRNG